MDSAQLNEIATKKNGHAKLTSMIDHRRKQLARLQAEIELIETARDAWFKEW